MELAFDPQGRSTSETTPEGTTTFTYDSLDRITGRAPEGQPAQSFAYDALGRLTTTTQGGLTRTNNYALSDAPILETTAITGSFSSSSAKSLSYGPTGLLESRIGAARPSYPVADEHGSLIGEISDLGKATLAREYDPFGAELAGPPPPDPADPSAPLAEESFDYLGAYARPGVYGSDLIHMGARVYDPEAGRFLSRDSLPGIEVEPQTQNPYAYGLNSPGRFYDLDGRNPIAVVVVGSIIVATGATVHVIAQTNPEWAEAEEELIDAAGDEIRDFANDVSSAVSKDNGQSPNGGSSSGKNGGSSSGASPTLRPDHPALAGGRGGSKVKDLVGPPNSVVRGSKGRVFRTDSQGRVVRDITKSRSKKVVPGRGYVKGPGRKDQPTAEELEWVRRLWE